MDVNDELRVLKWPLDTMSVVEFYGLELMSVVLLWCRLEDEITFSLCFTL